ncbi:MAG: sulfatase [Bacteroidota bacterium]
MTKLSLLLILLCGPFFLPAQQLNVLWIIGEDVSPDMACYGHPGVWTPHIDQLAADGVRYTRAYTTAPVCSPSRSAFMTGMYQMSIGAHNHRSHREDGYTLPPGVKVITDWLRDKGYYTANLVNLTGDPNEKYFKGTGKTDWNFHYEGKPFDSKNWSDLKDHQPFYAQVNFPETHRGGAWNNSHKNIERTANPDSVLLPPYYPDHPEARAVWAQYLNTIMSLDRKVGKVLELLERDGLADNTVVIFMGDHGRAMVRSKQWPYESGLRVPLIIRWPKGMTPPDGFEAGTVSDRMLYSIDVSATTLAIAGIQPPLGMQGRVFLGEWNSPDRQYVFGGRDRGDETVDRIRTVSDGRFRYLRNFYPDRPFLQTNRYKENEYPIIHLMRELQAEGKLTPDQERLLAPTRPTEELYDLRSDPYELNNLAKDPVYRDVLERLRGVLDAWMIEINDQGRIPESPEIPIFWENKMKEIYDTRIEAMLKKRANKQ